METSLTQPEIELCELNNGDNYNARIECTGKA